MFVKNSADHFRPGVKKHIVTESGRPIGNGKSYPQASDEAADKKQWKGGASKKQRQPVRPR
jgi:hypothetical protein